MSTGRRIKQLREERGLSRQEVGDRIGITYMTVWRWERGKTDIRDSSFRTLRSLANLHGMHVVEYLRKIGLIRDGHSGGNGNNL